MILLVCLAFQLVLSALVYSLLRFELDRRLGRAETATKRTLKTAGRKMLGTLETNKAEIALAKSTAFEAKVAADAAQAVAEQISSRFDHGEDVTDKRPISVEAYRRRGEDRFAKTLKQNSQTATFRQ